VSTFADALRADVDAKLRACVHCGFCLPECPTYQETGRETDSPRGRLHLIDALARGRIEPVPVVLGHLDACLDCRACETACPSGVAYGAVIERTRGHLDRVRPRTLVARAVRRVALRWLLPHRRRLALLAAPLRLLARPGVRRAVDRLGRLGALAPTAVGRPFSSGAPEVVPATAPHRGRVGLLLGCVMDAVMAPVHAASVRLIAGAGFDVHLPRAQTCCGALHLHGGDRAFAARLAARNVAAFAEVDEVVVNAAGCGSAMAEIGELLGEAPPFRVSDLATFLDRVGLPPLTTPVRRRAAWDAPCHLLHAAGVDAAPLRLLDAVPGLERVPLLGADRCCGSAGIYNLTHPEMADRLLARKLDEIAATGADLVVTANPGCQMQLDAGLRLRGAAVEVRHLAEVLAAALATPNSGGDGRRARPNRTAR